MKLQQHEFPEGDRFCKWCGALNHQYMTATCLQRDVPASELRPAPARRQFASEDFDTIGARIAELRKEQEVAWNTTDPEPAPYPDDMGDCCL